MKNISAQMYNENFYDRYKTHIVQFKLAKNRRLAREYHGVKNFYFLCCILVDVETGNNSIFDSDLKS